MDSVIENISLELDQHYRAQQLSFPEKAEFDRGSPTQSSGPSLESFVVRPSNHRRRARHNGRRLNRLAVVVAISIVGSGVVTVAAATALPDKPSTLTAEPRFDATAFYNAHPALATLRAKQPDLPQQANQEQPQTAGNLNKQQLDNAFIIVEVGRQMGLPPRAYVIALATALQESNLRNLANSDIPESLQYPYQGVGNDHDSVGLFQQRPSMGWGTVAALMDPAQASARFYTRLTQVYGWPSMSVAGAAQAVQRSAFPDAYAKHADRAQRIADTMP